MNKWGVRQIGFCFLIWAVLNLIGLIKNPGQTKGFLGITSFFTYTGPSLLHKAGPIEIMGWIGVGILAITGYNLLWIRSSGRIIALIILWWRTISSGIYFILTTLTAIFFFFSHKAMLSATITFFQWSRDVKGISLVLVYAGIFLIYAIPTNYLMRKDVKQLFERPDNSKEIAPVSDAASS